MPQRVPLEQVQSAPAPQTHGWHGTLHVGLVPQEQVVPPHEHGSGSQEPSQSSEVVQPHAPLFVQPQAAEPQGEVHCPLWVQEQSMPPPHEQDTAVVQELVPPH